VFSIEAERVMMIGAKRVLLGLESYQRMLGAMEKELRMHRKQLNGSGRTWEPSISADFESRHSAIRGKEALLEVSHPLQEWEDLCQRQPTDALSNFRRNHSDPSRKVLHVVQSSTNQHPTVDSHMPYIPSIVLRLVC